MLGLQEGTAAEVEAVVTLADTATALGSGDVDVLATPRLVALAEAATVAATAGSLAAGAVSVGTRVELEHLRPSPVGATVRVRARLQHVDGRLLRFEVVAHDAATGESLARGTVTRAVLDRTRFAASARPRGAQPE